MPRLVRLLARVNKDSDDDSSISRKNTPKPRSTQVAGWKGNPRRDEDVAGAAIDAAHVQLDRHRGSQSPWRFGSPARLIDAGNRYQNQDRQTSGPDYHHPLHSFTHYPRHSAISPGTGQPTAADTVLDGPTPTAPNYRRALVYTPKEGKSPGRNDNCVRQPRGLGGRLYRLGGRNIWTG